MASRLRTPVYCVCGHKGTLVCKENDSPFSRMWEEYSLSGFKAEGIEDTADTTSDEPILKRMQPTCPECGAVGKVSYEKPVG